MTLHEISENSHRTLKVKNILCSTHSSSSYTDTTTTSVSKYSSTGENRGTLNIPNPDISNLLKTVHATTKEVLKSINEDQLANLSKESSKDDFKKVIESLEDQIETAQQLFEMVANKKNELDVDVFCKWLNQGKSQFYSYSKSINSIEKILFQVLDNIEELHSQDTGISYVSLFDMIEQCSEKYARLHTLCIYLKSLFDSSSEFHEIYHSYMESIEDEILKMFEQLHNHQKSSAATSSNVPSLEELLRILSTPTSSHRQQRNISTSDSDLSFPSQSSKVIFVNAQDALVYEEYKKLVKSFEPLSTSLTDILAIKIEEFTSTHESADYLFELIELIKIKYTELIGTYEILELEMSGLRDTIIFERWSQTLDFHCNQLNLILDEVLPNAVVNMKNFYSKKYSDIYAYYGTVINSNVAMVEKYFKFVNLLNEKNFSHKLSKKVVYKKNELSFKWMQLKNLIPKNIINVDVLKNEKTASPSKARTNDASPKRGPANINSKAAHSINSSGKRKLRNSRRMRRSLLYDQQSSRISSTKDDELFTSLNRLSTIENIEEWTNLSKEVRRQSIGALIHQKLNIKPVVIKDADKLESPIKNNFSDYEFSESENESTKRYTEVELANQQDFEEIYRSHNKRMEEVDRTLKQQASTSTLRISESDRTFLGDNILQTPVNNVERCDPFVRMFESSSFRERIARNVVLHTRIPTIRDTGSTQLFFAKSETSNGDFNDLDSNPTRKVAVEKLVTLKENESCDNLRAAKQLVKPSDLKELLRKVTV